MRVEVHAMEFVDECCHVLGGPISDFDKIQILAVASEQIRRDNLGSESTTRLFRSVGIDFFARMFLNELTIPKDDNDDLQFVESIRSAALGILSFFVAEKEVASDEQTLKLIPHVLRVVGESTIGSTQFNDSIDFLKSLARFDAGRRALVSLPVLNKLPDTNFHQIASILVPIFIDNSITCQTNDNSACFNLFMSKMSTNFEKDNSQQKFQLCELINVVLLNVGVDQVSTFVGESWPDVIWKGLRDILTSRIDDKLRSPALNLSSTMLKCFGTSSKLENVERFHVLLFHLSSIEIRMQLEDRTFEQIWTNSILIVSCFTILEIAVTSFMDSFSDPRDRNQIVDSFQSAANAVFSTIVSLKDTTSTNSNKSCVHAMIRFLSLGLSHDILPLDSSVVLVLPYVLQIAEKSFYGYRQWHEENDGNLEHEPIDVLPILLPSLSRFVVLKESRRLILNKTPLLLNCLRFHWSILNDTNVSTERSTSSTSAMSTIFQTYVDCIVSESISVQNEEISSNLFDFIVQILPRCSCRRPILTTGSVLGLLIVENVERQLDENDHKLTTIVDAFLSWRQAQLDEDDTILANVGMKTMRGLLDKCRWLKSQLTSEIVEQIDLYRDVD